MKWSEIDADWWYLPGNRTKNGRAHRVWLSATVQGIIARRRTIRPATCEYVFPSIRNGSEQKRAAEPTLKYAPVTTIRKAVDRLTERAEIAAWVPHDLRRTCKTGLSELGVPPDVKDRVLNHIAARNVMDDHYDKYAYQAERRAALDRWEKWLLATLRKERVSFGSWETEVQRIKDELHAVDAPNVVPFARRG